MKKFLALIMAAMMLLGVVSALAEAGSPKPVTPTVKDEDEKTFFILHELGTKGQEYYDNLVAAENQLDVFTPEVQEAIKAAIGEDIIVNDMQGVTVVNWTEADGPQALKISFTTPYAPGDPVVAVLGYVKDGVAEFVLPAEVTADSEITMSWDSDMMAKGLEAAEMFYMIVSAPKAE
ncbi:MAG: hypothetical protein IKP10_06905 [Clostridia bacterium]|nr:hypothetical protein [Clostridia bacterium]